jgi:tetrahydromethanopterin S-methyltransferase subunit A
MKYDDLNLKETLIYDLIFNEKFNWIIELEEYIDLADIDEFVSEIEDILKRSEVEIFESSIFLSKEKNQWILKTKK